MSPKKWSVGVLTMWEGVKTCFFVYLWSLWSRSKLYLTSRLQFLIFWVFVFWKMAFGCPPQKSNTLEVLSWYTASSQQKGCEGRGQKNFCFYFLKISELFITKNHLPSLVREKKTRWYLVRKKCQQGTNAKVVIVRKQKSHLGWGFATPRTPTHKPKCYDVNLQWKCNTENYIWMSFGSNSEHSERMDNSAECFRILNSAEI